MGVGVALLEAVSQTRQSATSKYEAEHVQWLKHQTELEAELQKLRAKLNQDRYSNLTLHYVLTLQGIV